MAYELKGKLKEGTSTDDIWTVRGQADLYESKSSAKKASRLVKLLIEVEKALNSAEVAEIASSFDPTTTARYMEDAGLRLLPSPPPPPSPEALLSPPEDASDDDNKNASVAEKRAATATATATATPKASPRPSEKKNRRRRPPGGGGRGGGREGGEGGQKVGSAGSVKADGRGELDQTDVGGLGGTAGGLTATAAAAGAEAEPAAAMGKPLEAFVVGVAGCEVRCLLMVDERERRLVVAVGDNLTGEALLGCLFQEPAVVQLASHGLMRETAYVNWAAFQAACDILEWAGPLFKTSLERGSFEGYRVHCAGHSFGGAVAACLAGLLDGTINVEATASSKGGGGGSARKGAAAAATAGKGGGGGGEGSARRRSESLRDRRQKGGGQRAATTTSSELSGGGSSSESEGDATKATAGTGAVRVDGAAPWVGVCRDKVTCVTLGCPPCLSGNLRLPFVTSFVLGDDMVPRTSHESLRRLKLRLLQARRLKGLLSQGMAFGTSLITDVAGVALQGVRQATTLGEDDARLTVPGRVWFTKPRRLKNGATLARVMQGNLKEDMLWQLHDIMLTKSMLKHHRLDKYIKILDRV
ncbi:unnamed protein product [Laminaria digitata]